MRCQSLVVSLLFFVLASVGFAYVNTGLRNFDQIKEYERLYRIDPKGAEDYRRKCLGEKSGPALAAPVAMPARDPVQCAIDDCDKAIARDKNDVASYLKRGALLWSLYGQRPGLYDFREAARLGAKNADAQAALALAYCADQVRDAKQALELARAACAMTQHKNSKHLEVLAYAHSINGDFKSAADAQAKAVALLLATEVRPRECLSAYRLGIVPMRRDVVPFQELLAPAQ